MPAHYQSTATSFITADRFAIVGALTTQAANAGFFQQTHTQTDSWHQQIVILRGALERLAEQSDIASWTVLLEYPIPRRAKRIDAVLLAEGLILVLEFKCGSTSYAGDAVAQVEDYCLDLRDFHLQSRLRCIAPIVVASEAPSVPCAPIEVTDWVAEVSRANTSTLDAVIGNAIASLGSGKLIDAQAWDHGDYSPTPTIVEAAQHLYAGQNVREISRCHGGVDNLTKTTDAVIHAVSDAVENGSKMICFVTGVPGAGKTLAGLNIVHNKLLHEGDLGVFLSGNGPLVKVLTEALARDHRSRKGVPIEESRRKVSTFVHNVHRFIDAYYEAPSKVPEDRVIIFDEAQRAWNREQSNRKFKRPFSEPELVLSIMDRHPGWAVIVCLIGSGQEINAGEAGISEWGRTLVDQFPHWKVMVSPLLLESVEGGKEGLFEKQPRSIEVHLDPSLHLDVSLRSYRAEVLSEWVEAVLDSRPDLARRLLEEMQNYPVGITRSLDRARDWLRCRQRGTRRVGLTASSGARRLRALGLDVTNAVDVEQWFLNPLSDVRSSYSLETVATEFDIQGLELDWTCVAWGGDLHRNCERWVYRQFRGTDWQSVGSDARKQYILNKYRVLLTRAREGMIIFVPQGSSDDRTRPPDIYDSVVDYLRACGLGLLD